MIYKIDQALNPHPYITRDMTYVIVGYLWMKIIIIIKMKNK